MSADHIGKEQTVEALGKTWRVGRWTRNVWDDFTAWAKDNLPDPLQEVESSIERMMTLAAKAGTAEEKDPAKKAELLRTAQMWEAQADHLLRMALDKKTSYLSVNSPEMGSLINSVVGGAQLLHLLLKTHQPDSTVDDAYWIIQELGGERLQAIYQIASGKAPRGNAEAPAA
jgi:hypothetical protein